MNYENLQVKYPSQMLIVSFQNPDARIEHFPKASTQFRIFKAKAPSPSFHFNLTCDVGGCYGVLPTFRDTI